MTAGRVSMALGLCFIIIWFFLFPAEPWNPNADIYDNLSVARNLLEGDGLTSDLIYPMTTAFDWGRQLPQPLLHRPPGFALLLVPALMVADGDASLAPQVVRWLQMGILFLIISVGLSGFLKRGLGSAGLAWVLILLFSPLLGSAVNQGWVEVPCALVLLVLWLRLRDRKLHLTKMREALVDGALVGVLALLRGDLLWVPVLWLLASVMFSSRHQRSSAMVLVQYLAPALGMWLVVTLPWWIHVTMVAGSPFFNPLSYSLEFDLSTNWWDYPRLRGLEPEAPLDNLRHNLIPAMVKIRHGLRIFMETLGQWLPWTIWGGGLVLGVSSWLRHRRHGVLRAGGPLVLLVVTLGGMILLYALVSQEVRHLLVLLPVLAWELMLVAAQRMRQLLASQRMYGPILASVVAGAIIATPTGDPEMTRYNVEARLQGIKVEKLVREVNTWPQGPIFTDNAAVCWYTGRTGVWSPLDAGVEETIRGTVPGMQEARWVKLNSHGAE